MVSPCISRASILLLALAGAFAHGSIDERAGAMSLRDLPLRRDVRQLAPPSGANYAEPSMQQRASQQLTSARFMQRALASGEQDVRAAEHAAACVTRSQTKQVAEVLARDHAITFEQLSSLAQRKNWSVDTLSSMAVPKEGAAQPLPTQDSGAVAAANFDSQFIADQIRDHQRSIAMFREQAENGDDADIKAFAKNLLPKLEERLSELRGLQP
jgi:putative membrane protein